MRLLDKLASWIEHNEALDAPSQQLADVATAARMDNRAVKTVLSGEPLGHPLHPLLVALPIGSWTTAAYFDLVARDPETARRLIGIGVLTALPTMAAGLHDYKSTHGPEQRVGFVHAVGNTIALGCYAGSYIARRTDRQGLGVALSLLGAAAMGGAGWAGGHLSYALGVGVDTTTFLPGTAVWKAVASRDDVAGGVLVSRDVDGVSVLISEVAGEVVAIANRCTHRGAPLSDGERDGDCVRCPWHDSAFALRDGAVEEGPASRPQPIYDVKLDGETILVRRRSVSYMAEHSA